MFEIVVLNLLRKTAYNILYTIILMMTLLYRFDTSISLLKVNNFTINEHCKMLIENIINKLIFMMTIEDIFIFIQLGTFYNSNS